MQQNILISTNNQMKNTITECISGNRIAGLNSLLGCIRFLSVSSFFSINKIKYLVALSSFLISVSGNLSFP